MNTKITTLTIALAALIVGYVLSHPLVFGLCSNTYQTENYIGCLDSSIKSIGFPLLVFASWILPIVVIVTFLSEKIFRSWLYFAVVMVFLATILIANQPVLPSSMLSADRLDTAQFAGQFFDGISFIVLVWKYIAARRIKAVS